MAAMKLLHLIAGGAHGGAETFAMDAIAALQERGVAQFVLCRPHKNFAARLRQAEVEFAPLRFSRWWRGRQSRRIFETIRDYGPDVVHCWMSRAASFMPAESGVPALGWFGGYYKLKYYRNCDYYMGVSRDIVDYVAAQSRRPERVFLAHTFGTLPADKPVARADFGIPDGMPVVLLLGRMHPVKGVDVLLHAACDLDAFFLIAGDGPELAGYRRLARRLGVAERVRFLGWRQDRAALLDLADVCALPSRREPFGTVMAEAWHRNTPLVAAKAEGPRQYVAHGENGLLCEIDDVADLAAKLRAVLDDKQLRQRLVEGGRRSYESLFSKDVAVASLLEAYREIMRRGA